MVKLVSYSEKESIFFRKLLSFPSCWMVEAAHFAFNEVRDGTHNSPKVVEEGFRLITSKNLKPVGIDFSNTKIISEEDYYEIKKRSEVKTGDVLFSMIGTIGNVAIVGLNTEFAIKNVGLFRTQPKLLDPEFSMYWLKSQTFQKYLEQLKRGGNQKFVSLGVLRCSPVPLPPLAEQKEIATRLDKLLTQVDTLKTRLDAIPTLLKRFRQSVLAAAVSGKLTEDWRKTTELIDWTAGNLSDFVYKPNYGTSSKSQKEGDVPVLRMGNLQNGKLDWTNLVYTSDVVEIEKYKLYKGDVLFNRTNSPELVGKTSIFRGEKEAIFAGYLIRIQCKDELNPEFLNYHLNSSSAKQYCYSVKSDGVSQSNINAKKLVAYPINTPPLEEQTKIVTRVETLFTFADKIEQQVTQAQNRINNLTQSILAKAFRGELTADWRKQYPELIRGENSAEALLARIKTEREKLAKKPKHKRRSGR